MRKKMCRRCGRTTLHSRKERGEIRGKRIRLTNPRRHWYCVECIARMMTEFVRKATVAQETGHVQVD